MTLDAPDATDEQLDALKGAVDAHCPLVASLNNPLDLTTSVVKAEPSGASSVVQDNLKEGVMALVGAAKEDGTALQMKYGSSSVLKGDGLLTTATLTGGHTIIIDEPESMPGGTNKGTNPLDLFCASFGTCQGKKKQFVCLGIPKTTTPFDLTSCCLSSLSFFSS